MVCSGEHLGLVLSYFGIRQKDAATAVGVDPAMVSRWKNGSGRLGASSPRMAALVDYILYPGHPLSEADLRWLRSRFVEEGLNVHLTGTDGLCNALANYLANDGSRVDQDFQECRQLFMEEQFALGGAGAIAEVVRSELAKLPVGQSFYLVSAIAGIEAEPAFLSVVTGALRRGVRLRLLINTTLKPIGTKDSGPVEDRVTQVYLPLATSPKVQIRYTDLAEAPCVPTGFCTMLLVPGRLCLHMSRASGGAAPVACGVRSKAYLMQTKGATDDMWAHSERAFENPREFTPRVVSANMARFYANTSELSVASDGLNPIFMSDVAFRRLLERKGLGKEEITWRVEAFQREQEGLERQLANGASYHEMTCAVDAATIAERNCVQVYGTTLVDVRDVDIPTAIDILQGYLRFATLYPFFDTRFASASKDLSRGLWILSHQAPGTGDAAGGVIHWRREENELCQLVSHHPRIMAAVRELYQDAWEQFRFRMWHEGRLVTSNDDVGPSVTIRFIREKMDELEQLGSRCRAVRGANPHSASA